jgi:hypothetical protein
LLALWSIAKRGIQRLFDWPDDADDLKNVEASLQEFHHVDPGGFGFRYMTQSTTTAEPSIDPRTGPDVV